MKKKASKAVATTSSQSTDDDDHYEEFLSGIQSRFANLTATKVPLFTTSSALSFEQFLAALPERRQHYTCRACAQFVERFGGLVTVDPSGKATPVMWDVETAPPYFREAVKRIAHEVSRAKISGVFLSSEKTWGIHNSVGKKAPGYWQHMAVTPPASLIFKHPLLTASQVAAEKLQEREMVIRGLVEFPLDVVKQAHTLLASESLYRSEKCLGVAKWLLELHEARAKTKNSAVKENLTWLAVALAPPGFAHVKSSMIGTLLEDIAAGLPFADCARKFADKMHPLQYQRPTSAPSDGNIAQAEAIMARLGAAGSLQRRFARLEDIQALWLPRLAKADQEPTGGVFAHLKSKAKSTPQIEAPAVTMAWDKFQRVALPDAVRIEYQVQARTKSYAALVTAANADAPPILQWDSAEQRNPVSWYLRVNGSQPHEWNLQAGESRDVTAVTFKPSMWNDGKFPHQGECVFFILRGSRDINHERSGGLFPEILRSEYHAVRKTIEAYATNAVIEGKDEATACGLMLQKGQNWDDIFRVTAKDGTRVLYRLDRWD